MMSIAKILPNYIFVNSIHCFRDNKFGNSLDFTNYELL